MSVKVGERMKDGRLMTQARWDAIHRNLASAHSKRYKRRKRGPYKRRNQLTGAANQFAASLTTLVASVVDERLKALRFTLK